MLPDPSGAMESRVRIGIPIEAPLPRWIRIAKGKRSLTRAWRPGQNGFSCLPADGFWVKIGETEDGWCYEVRMIGAGLNLSGGSRGNSAGDVRAALL